MTPELGHFALVLALFLALIQASLPLLGAARANPSLMAVAGYAAQGQLLFIAIAFLALMHAYVVSDFSVAAVARPLIESYRDDPEIDRLLTRLHDGARPAAVTTSE